MNREICTSFLVAAAALGSLAPMCVGDVTNTAQIGINPNISGGSGPYSQNVVQPGTIDISGSATGGSNSSGAASCHVEYGLVRMSGSAAGSLSSVARGIFHDRLVITAPGVPTNTTGTLTFSVIVSGSVAAPAGASAGRWALQADLGGGVFDINRQGQIISPELSSAGYIGDPFGTYQATISFQFGQGLPLDVEFTGTAGAGNGQSGPGSAAFGAPLVVRWGGIHNIAINGNPVTTYTISSDSGTHWADPISGCAADFDGDGSVDFFDYDAFVTCFEGGACPPGRTADFDGDGSVDFFDYDGFVVAFEAGC